MSSEPEAHLALLLDGPLQAWGTHSRFQRRTTGGHPSKSAVIGMIAAAMGIGKDEREAERLASLAALRLTSYRMNRAQRNAVRLMDYHTVGGGFDKKTDPLSIPRKASGGPSDNAVLTHREYLMDARFGVILSGSRNVLAEAAASLADPKWGIWLGRKSCPPATPLAGHPASDQVLDSLDAAFQWLKTRAELPTDSQEADFDRMTEETSAGHELVPDSPVSFGQREFHPRPVTHRPSR